MSVANSGSVPRPVIVKSFAAIPALADATDTDLFLVTIPALSAYSYYGVGNLVVVANTALATALGGAVFTTNADNSALPAGSFLTALCNIGASVVQPASTSLAINGFLYNTSSADITIKFRINVNVSAGTSNVTGARVFFVPIPVSGYGL